MQIGNTVEAYNPTTGKSQPQIVQSGWLNHDLADMQVQASDSGTTLLVASDSAATTHAGS